MLKMLVVIAVVDLVARFVELRGGQVSTHQKAFLYIQKDVARALLLFENIWGTNRSHYIPNTDNVDPLVRFLKDNDSSVPSDAFDSLCWQMLVRISTHKVPSGPSLHGIEGT